MAVKKRVCLKCEKSLSLNEFFVSNNKFSSNDDRHPVCKTCITQELNINNEFEVIQMCFTLNRPFNQELWSNAIEQSKKKKGKESTFGIYIKNFNMQQFKHMAFTPTIQSSSKAPQDVMDIELTQEVLDRWITIGETTDIPTLEREYQSLIKQHGVDDYTKLAMLRDIVQTGYFARNNLMKNHIKEYNDLMKLKNQMIKDAGISPNQDKDTTKESFGLWIKQIEETEPIPEPHEKFKDVDGIFKYFKKWFVDHFSRMLGFSSTAEYMELVENAPVDEEDDTHG